MKSLLTFGFALALCINLPAAENPSSPVGPVSSPGAPSVGPVSSPGVPSVSPASSPSTPPPGTLKQTGPTTFEIGKVRLDKAQKTVTFPAFLNMDKGMIEYVIVTTTGKTHESLVRTDAQPYHIHVAMLLLGAKGAGTNAFPEDPKAPIPGEKVDIQISWKDPNGVEKRCPPEDFIINQQAHAPATRSPWIYNGSRVLVGPVSSPGVQGTFMAQDIGSIVSTMTDPDALMNNPRAGHENDKIWEIKSEGLPPVGWPMEVTFTLKP